MQKNPTSIHLLSQFQGFLESCCPAVWVAPLHFRRLQSCLIRQVALNKGSSGHGPPRPLALEELQWWIHQHQTCECEPNTASSDRNHDHLGRLQNGVGCHLLQSVHQRTLVESGKPPPYQCLGAKSNLFSSTGFPETPVESIGETLP